MVLFMLNNNYYVYLTNFIQKVYELQIKFNIETRKILLLV